MTVRLRSESAFISPGSAYCKLTNTLSCCRIFSDSTSSCNLASRSAFNCLLLSVAGTNGKTCTCKIASSWNLSWSWESRQQKCAALCSWLVPENLHTDSECAQGWLGPIKLIRSPQIPESNAEGDQYKLRRAIPLSEYNPSLLTGAARNPPSPYFFSSSPRGSLWYGHP